MPTRPNFLNRKSRDRTSSASTSSKEFTGFNVDEMKEERESNSEQPCSPSYLPAAGNVRRQNKKKSTKYISTLVKDSGMLFV